MLSRYIATLLHRYIISSFVPPQELPPYYTLPLHHYIATSLHRYIATLLHCYIATSLHCYIAYSGILWHTLAYSCILATLLLRYIGTSSLLLFPHKSFHHTMLSRYIATSLHRYIISSFVPPQELPPYYALSLHCIFLHTLAYIGIL